jgi:hypothetical protein
MNLLSKQALRRRPFLSLLGFDALGCHSELHVIVHDQVQLFVRHPVVPCESPIDFVDEWFGL